MSKEHGLTFIELLATLTLLALLVSVALPLTQLAAKRSREDALRQALSQIRRGIDRYKQAYDDKKIENTMGKTGYPPSLNHLVDGVTDIKDPHGAKIYFLRRLPRDPFCYCDDKEPAQTWGLRSYASPPSSPSAGEDVFDVFSESKEIGLNGIPYRDW